MRRIPSAKLLSLTAISAAALLGACAGMDRDTMFENNGPPPASAPARDGHAQSSTPSESNRAAATSPQQMAQGNPNATTAGQAPPPASDQMSNGQMAMPAAPTTFTDAQLQSFVTASRQIEPLNRQVQTATPEQRTALATQIRGILTANNLDGATYNAIATRAQTDPALAQRIAAMQGGNPNG